MTNRSNYGSVAIRRVPAEGGNVYVPRYFGDNQKEPKYVKARERAVATFTSVNAIMRGKSIARLCAEASRTSRSNPRISESQLVKKISKILLN
ncbi:MAG: hypothetical protein AABX79_02210 [Nanoarchaeota archaeon]